MFLFKVSVFVHDDTGLCVGIKILDGDIVSAHTTSNMVICINFSFLLPLQKAAEISVCTAEVSLSMTLTPSQLQMTLQLVTQPRGNRVILLGSIKYFISLIPAV